VPTARLHSGNTQSCGCFQKEIIANRNLKVTANDSIVGNLYVFELLNANESFLKCGFTKDLEKRITILHRLGYAIRPIYVVSGSVSLMLYHEEILHGRNPNFQSPIEQYKYRPYSLFDGYTECYTHLALLELCEYLSELEGEINDKIR
jgi:hypothetical protein